MDDTGRKGLKNRGTWIVKDRMTKEVKRNPKIAHVGGAPASEPAVGSSLQNPCPFSSTKAQRPHVITLSRSPCPMNTQQLTLGLRDCNEKKIQNRSE